jgi:hypothetical protein
MAFTIFVKKNHTFSLARAARPQRENVTASVFFLELEEALRTPTTPVRFALNYFLLWQVVYQVFYALPEKRGDGGILCCGSRDFPGS